MPELYRPEALERLSSPEQLDRLVQVTSPMGWLALLTTALLLFAVVIWGFLGRLPLTVKGPGVLLRQGGLSTVPVMASGQLVEVLVETGDVVSKGQVLARLQPATQFPIVARVEILAPRAGEVATVHVSPGAFLNAGESLLSLRAEEGDLRALLYLPADQGKRVRPGMVARISPSTVPVEDYGYLLGRVRDVSSYPSDRRGMIDTLGSEDLVDFFLRDGNVYQAAPIQVVVELDRDLSTPTGYRWSSLPGPDFGVTAGTVCDSRIVVESQRPVDLVIPMLDRLLHAEPF